MGRPYNGAMDPAAPPEPQSYPWSHLGEGSPRLTQHGAWLQACVEALAPPAALRFVMVGD